MTKPLIFDVSGVHGASGTSGINRGRSTASYGSDGLSGGHGTDGQHGTSAGYIEVQLTIPKTTVDIPKNVVLPNPIDADVKLDSSAVCTAGRLQTMDKILKFSPGESISFLAWGGHGGNGGSGGNGEHGGMGLQGARGGPGGDGGDGGNAGKGGDGGSGGTIEISAPKADTHLFTLCGSMKYSCGKGGSAGSAGIGGKSFQGYLTPPV